MVELAGDLEMVISKWIRRILCITIESAVKLVSLKGG